MNAKTERDARDEEVLGLLRTNHSDAAKRLIDVFGDRVYGLSIRILGSEEDAKEAVQETFLTVWRKWSTFKGKSRFSSWIYRIAANQAYMKLRKKRKRMNDVSLDQLNVRSDSIEAAHSDPLSHYWKSSDKSPDAALEQQERTRLIDEAVQGLSTTYRTAYILKDVEGLSLKEIAEVMGLSEPAVKSRVHRARLTLRKRLTPALKH